MKIVKPLEKNGVSVFLAGSIEMNKARLWQNEVQERFAGYPITFLNPRRDDWDSSWTQSVMDDNFRTQVEWEVKHISMADIVFFYIDPNTQAPITLWELGYMMKDTRKIIVCCPNGYWRKGNIEVYSKIFGFPLIEDFDTACELLRSRIEKEVYG